MPTVAPLLSVVVPLYNERGGLAEFHRLLVDVVRQVSDGSYEIVYCDDGSTDNPAELIERWHSKDKSVRLVCLSRNFGKEYALSAGIAQASGRAILMLDGDGQHPVERIPEFVQAWKDGTQVVVGIRTDNGSASSLKRLGSAVFNQTFKHLTGQALLSGATDFRLIDHAVQKAFLELPENNRMTRGLIDWLGFRRSYIYYEAKPRLHGAAGYSLQKLTRLAVDGFVSLTPRPLYIFGYVGVLFTCAALLVGVAVVAEQLILGDPLRWKFTGTAMLGILIIFLVGLMLISQAILSLYIANIQSQSRRRPLYIIDYRHSVGIGKTDA